MVTPFLSTKFFIPQPRKNHIRRRELFNLLNEGVQNKLVLISAPPGYGKTTLITSWLKNQELSAAWFSIDTGDNEYYRFFYYLLEAIHQKDIRVGETILQILQSSSPPAPEILVELFLNELSTIAQELILVVDDYHLITNMSIHKDFCQIIESSSTHLHFIISSRTELPFSVSKLRASDNFMELTQTELSLTLEDSSIFMNKVMGVRLQPAEIAVLKERTEGWLVGMQLAALSLRGLSNPIDFINSFKGENRFIGDYLVDEVLVHIPADLQDFLLRTSILSRMEASLCNFVLQIENSQEQLESIDKQHLFIIPLDDTRQWFRYHHLFGEMLYTRLSRKSPEIITELYRRASAWHAKHELKEEAIEYSLNGYDYPRSAELINETSLTILSQGGWNKVLNWCDRIPEAEFHRLPNLWTTYFGALINAGLITTAEKRIKEIFIKDFFEQHYMDENLERVKGILVTVRGVIILHSKVDPLQAKDVLTEAQGYLLGDATIRQTFVSVNYGVCCLLLGEIDDAKNAFEKSIAWGKRDDFSLIIVMGSSYLAETFVITGQLIKAEKLFQETSRFVHEMGLQKGAVFSKTNLGLGNLYYEWNKLDEALPYLTEGVRLAEQGGYLDQLLPGYAALALIQSKQGDLDSVRKTIQRARKMAKRYDDPSAVLSFINAMEANMALQRSAFVIVDNWLVSQKKRSSKFADLFLQYEQTTLARAIGAKGDYSTMSELIRPLWESALRQGRMKDAISFEVLLAKSLFLSGEPLPARAILQGALYKSESEHFVRTFLDEGNVIISMIKELLASRKYREPSSDECSNDYLNFLLEEVAKETLKVSSHQGISKTVHGLKPLTDHELDILHMLASGYPNKQIAQELNISLNTVKFHLKNIYGKLGVMNRVQAAKLLQKEEQ